MRASITRTPSSTGKYSSTVRTLNVGPVFPLDQVVGIVKKGKPQKINGSVAFKGRLAVTKGKGLLNAQMVNIEGIVTGIVRRAIE